MNYEMNRIANCRNQFQGNAKRVLCVCSAGLLRSPTTALVLSQEPYNYNTRAAGLVKEFALIPVDTVLLTWADEIVCMEAEQAETLGNMVNALDMTKHIVCLVIDDSYPYRDAELIKKISERYAEFLQRED